MTTTINPPTPRSGVRNFHKALLQQALTPRRGGVHSALPRRPHRVGSLVRGALLLPILVLGLGLAVSGLLPAVVVGIGLFLPVLLPVFLLALAACGDGCVAATARQ